MLWILDRPRVIRDPKIYDSSYKWFMYNGNLMVPNERSKCIYPDKYKPFSLLEPILQAVFRGERGLTLLKHYYSEDKLYEPGGIYRCFFTYYDEEFMNSLYGETDFDPIPFKAFCHFDYEVVLNIECALILPDDSVERVKNRIRKISQKDLIHQIAILGKTLVVRGQYPLGKQFANIESFIKFLQNQWSYTVMIETPNISESQFDQVWNNEWQKMLIGPLYDEGGNPLVSAEEIFFPSNERDRGIYFYSSKAEVLEQNEDRIVHEMYLINDDINTVNYGNASIDRFLVKETNPTITTYTKYPYIVKLSGKVQISSDQFEELSELWESQDIEEVCSHIQDYCDSHNCDLFPFSLCRLVFHHPNEGTSFIEIIVSGIVPGLMRGVTVIGLLGLYEKTVCRIYSELSIEPSV